MSKRAITLSGFALNSLHHGHEIMVADSDGATVAVRPEFTTILEPLQADRQLVLSDVVLAEVAAGESRVVPSAGDRTYGWTVRVAQ